jgi:hypothetical protein
VPKKRSGDDQAPRRRRGAGASVAEPQRGLLLRILLYSPKDMVAGLIAFAAASAILSNALFLQQGPHPAPMFGSGAAASALLLPSPIPRPRPAQADALPLGESRLSESTLLDPRPVEPRPAEPRPAEPRPAEPRPADPRIAEARIAEPRSVERAADQRSNDPLANLVKVTAPGPLPQVNAVRPPAPIPQPVALTGSRRVAAIQRLLTEYGYGQLKPTGTVGADTRIAIEKFERERRLAVTGQVSERLVRELAAVTGRPIE